MNNITLTIRGANFSGLFKEFKKQNIQTKNIKRLNQTEIAITIKAKQKAKFIAILNEKCYTIVSQKNSQQKTFIRPFQNLSIIVGIIFGLLLNVLSTFFVWNVCLVGDESLKPSIQKTLKENGIKPFVLKGNINKQNIQNILYENVSGISLLSISQRGTTLFVHYTQKTSAQNNLSENENIIAKNDGLVASVLVSSGTAMVKVGDYVKKGQVLISKTEQNASGHVFAYVWKSATVQFPLQTLVWARTGNVFKNYKIVFKNSVLFETNQKSGFQKSETEEKTIYLTNKVLPIKKIEQTEYELTQIEITQNFDEENKEKMVSQAKLLCWEQIAGNENILEEKTEINFVPNIYFVTHYIKIKEQIS